MARSDATELVLNRTWRPALSITGAAACPARRRRQRAAPADHAQALAAHAADLRRGAAPPSALKRALETRPALRRQGRFEAEKGSAGWNAPALAPWLERRARSAPRKAHFGKPAVRDGRGRHDPVHGDARREVPRGAVPDHRRARARSPTPTAPTSSCTCPTGKRSRRAWPRARRARPSRGVKARRIRRGLIGETRWPESDVEWPSRVKKRPTPRD